MLEENTLVRFFAIFDGHGDFGKEASNLANQEIEGFIRANIKKILKLRDQRDYKEKVKKMLKGMYIDCQKKYERNVSDSMRVKTSLIEKAIRSIRHHYGLHSPDRVGAVHYECWRLSCHHVQRGGWRNIGYGAKYRSQTLPSNGERAYRKGRWRDNAQGGH
jgi:hypothetical protein